jgi:hypothetical protein
MSVTSSAVCTERESHRICWFRRSNIGTLSAVKFQDLAAVVKKNSIIRDITPCNPLEVNRRF